MVRAEPDQTHQIERARRMTAQTRKLTTVTSEEAKTRQHHAGRQKPVMQKIRWKSPKDRTLSAADLCAPLWTHSALRPPPWPTNSYPPVGIAQG